MRRKDTTRTKDSIKEVPEYAVIYDAPIEMVEVMERGRTIRRPKVPPRSSKSGSSASRSTSPKVSIETQTPTSSLTMRRPSPRVEEIVSYLIKKNHVKLLTKWHVANNQHYNIFTGILVFSFCDISKL